ncbi:hypothetical protein Patl1_27582 [Pistacia atlantica]|uniref:Uncharacterized protein n=1 Tax=Pistacia atlantica TaxID=434234 RepID=A0ACC1BGD8_9ROSI|nr:hypothetical protein Patl1_27582 [Pistacia atlantica]
MDMFVTADPANIHYIMSSNFSNFLKGDEFKQIFDVLGDRYFQFGLRFVEKPKESCSSSDESSEISKVKTTLEEEEKGLIPILENVAKEGKATGLAGFVSEACCTCTRKSGSYKDMHWRRKEALRLFPPVPFERKVPIEADIPSKDQELVLAKRLLSLKMKAVAATILHNYDVQVVEGQSLGPNV